MQQHGAAGSRGWALLPLSGYTDISAVGAVPVRSCFAAQSRLARFPTLDRELQRVELMCGLRDGLGAMHSENLFDAYAGPWM